MVGGLVEFILCWGVIVLFLKLFLMKLWWFFIYLFFYILCCLMIFFIFVLFRVDIGFFFNFLIFFGWFYICLAENNRTPFDFSEGESELVSGFNVEFGGGLFSLIFVCEYGIILFFSFFSVFVFFGGVGFFYKFIFICFFYVWIRCVFPRYRYDFLMASAWKILLPFSLFFLFFVILFFSF